MSLWGYEEIDMQTNAGGTYKKGWRSNVIRGDEEIYMQINAGEVNKKGWRCNVVSGY